MPVRFKKQPTKPFARNPLSTVATPRPTFAGQLAWFLQALGLSLLVTAITFRVYQPSYAPGVDGPLLWLYNYAAAFDLSLTRFILFPFGPLAFLTEPLPFGNNLVKAAVVHAALSIAFCMNVFALMRTPERKDWLPPTLLLTPLLLALNYMLLITGVVASFLLLALRRRDARWAAPAVIVGAFALLVKSYAGIMAGLLFAMYLLLLVLDRRSWKPVATLALLWCVVFFGSWLVMFGGLDGSLRYLVGLQQLSSGNTVAMALYPHNDWWLLALAAVLFVLLPFINRSEEALVFYGLFALATFGAWKHAMVREDIYHARGLFVYLLLFFGLLLAFTRVRRYNILLIGGLVLCLVFANLRHAYFYDGFHINAMRLNALVEFVFAHDGFKARHNAVTEAGLQSRKLNAALVGQLNGRSVDVYPWDYGYLAANPSLRWQPRPVIQSYAAYTPWLDARNAEHFNSDRAPEFILWETRADPDRPKRGSLNSIDGRYQLNDEPQTLLAILNTYRPVVKSNYLVVWERSTGQRLGETTVLSTTTTHWNSWIDVPPTAESILRVNAGVRQTLWGRIKQALYKPEAIYMDALLTNGDAITRKVIPTNPNGIWINPTVLHPQSNEVEPAAVRIRFRTNGMSEFNERIDITWLTTPLLHTSDTVAGGGLFGKTILNTDRTLLSARLDANGSTSLNSIAAFIPMSDPWMVPQRSYSNALVVPLDSLAIDSTITITAGIWSKTNSLNDVKLVVSIENDGYTTMWEHVVLRQATGPAGDLNYNSIRVNAETGESKPGAVLKVYVWNNSDLPATVENITVVVTAPEAGSLDNRQVATP